MKNNTPPASSSHAVLAQASGPLCRTMAIALLGATLAASPIDARQPASTAFSSVPEGDAPQGILVAAGAVRRSADLSAHPAQTRAVRALKGFARAHWSDISGLDMVDLSRFHVEATRGWQAPATPRFHGAEVLAADDTALYLMLRGPRLPASFEIVHRHLVFFARYDLASGQLADVSVSIRGEVHE